MGDSRAARQTQNGTHGPGGFVWGYAHPPFTLLSLPRSTASGWPAPGSSELQGGLRSSTSRLPAPSLSFLEPLHTHCPAPVSPHLCHGDASRRGQFSHSDEITRPHFSRDDDALCRGGVGGSPAGIPTGSRKTSAPRSTA